MFNTKLERLPEETERFLPEQVKLIRSFYFSKINKQKEKTEEKPAQESGSC